MTDTKLIAHQIRQAVIKMLAGAGSGHPAGALDLADFLAVLYFSDILNLDPKQPKNPERDRVILSAGHTCPGLYPTLALKGFFPVKELDTLRQFGSRLQGHPVYQHHSSETTVNQPANLPGIEATGGSLGQGSSFAVGVALGLKQLHENKIISRLPQVYCLMGDGELQEGQCWEAFMAAGKFQLHHLTFVIDRNGIQIDGFTETVMSLEPLKAKLDSFNLLTIELDGHNHQRIKETLQFDRAFQPKPTALILHTTPGKNIAFMENQPSWHGKSLNLGDAVEALRELQTITSTELVGENIHD